MYDRITNVHSINNLIWVWSTPESDWYPGNARVDMIGYDSYPGSYNYNCQGGMFANLTKLVNQGKMVMLTENGPIPDFQQCLLDGVKWGLFMSWNDLVFSQNALDHIKKVYAYPSVISLENAKGYLPKYNLRAE